MFKVFDILKIKPFPMIPVNVNEVTIHVEKDGKFTIKDIID